MKKLPKTLNLTLKIWRQQGPQSKGRFEKIPVKNVSVHMSFIELLDSVNEQLTLEGRDPIAFDNDCREGICGACGAVVEGRAHGPEKATTLCQLHMRKFSDGDTIVVEPFRAKAFKVVKDLVVDRSALDKIIQSGGYISVNTGGSPDANALPIAQETADKAMMPRHVSAAARVSQPVPAHLQCYLSVARFLNWHCCPRANPKPRSVL